jgi:hypothetical protein
MPFLGAEELPYFHETPNSVGQIEWAKPGERIKRAGGWTGARRKKTHYMTMQVSVQKLTN